MRVLFIAGGFTPPGGIESFLHSLSRMLVARGNAVGLLCWGPRSRLLDEIAGSGVAVRRQGFRWGCRLSIPDLTLGLRHCIAQVAQHDVVVFTKIPPDSILRSLRQIEGGGRHRSFIYVTGYRPSEMWSDERPAIGTLNAFDVIVVQAAGFAEELRSYGYRGSIETIPYIPPAPAAPCPLPGTADRLRLGFLGRLVPQKNLGYLLQAFDHLATRRAVAPSLATSWELHIFGDGPAKPELQQAAAARGLQSRVHFHGAIAPDAVAGAIDSCHLFAFSSLSEGQCLAALEILSRGRPIVATPVGAFPEFLTAVELGRLAPLDDAERFASTLGQVGFDLLRGWLTPQAVQSRFAERFPHDQIIDRYCRLFAAQGRVVSSSILSVVMSQ